MDDIGQLVDDILGEPEEGMGPWREQPWFHLCYRSEPEFVSAYEEHRRTRTWRAGAMALASGLSPKKGRGGRKWPAGTFNQGLAAKKTRKRRRCKGPEEPATKKRRTCKGHE